MTVYDYVGHVAYLLNTLNNPKYNMVCTVYLAEGLF